MAHDRRPPRTVRRNIKAVAAAALAAVDLVLAHWLAGGKREGVEYVALNPKRADGKPGSFKVNTASGAWSDFATGDKGGDLVALVAYLEACSQPDAADRLARFLGMPDPDSTPPRTPPPARPAAPPAPADSIVIPVPADAPPCPVAHPKLGKPTRQWTYFDAARYTLGFVVRFDPSEGEKVIMWMTCWREPDGRLIWKWKAPPAPRPLYGLDRLAARPDAPVLVVEGEKATDAAVRLLPAFVPITSPGGSKAAGKAEWSPLRGREVLIWSDADAPGAAYAEDVARLALAAGARAVRVLNLAALESLRGESLPPGWDAHDAMIDRLDPAELARVVMDPANWTERGEPAPTKSPTRPTVGERFLLIEAGNADDMRPGIYYVPTARNRQTGEWIDGAPQWICSPLTVAAYTRNAYGEEWGRLLVFFDRDGRRRQWAMPATMLARNGDELREELLRLGLEITTDGNLRRKLCEFIQQADPGVFVRCVDRTGWHGDTFE